MACGVVEGKRVLLPPGTAVTVNYEGSARKGVIPAPEDPFALQNVSAELDDVETIPVRMNSVYHYFAPRNIQPSGLIHEPVVIPETGAVVGSPHELHGFSGFVNSSGTVFFKKDLVFLKSKSYLEIEGIFIRSPESIIVIGRRCISGIGVKENNLHVVETEFEVSASEVLSLVNRSRFTKYHPSWPKKMFEYLSPEGPRAVLKSEFADTIYTLDQPPPGVPCSLCHFSGDSPWTGPMIGFYPSYRVDPRPNDITWVHLLCARFTSATFVSGPSSNVTKRVAQCSKSRCCICNDSCSSTGCLNPAHNKSYHVHCVRQKGWVECLKKKCRLPDPRDNAHLLPADVWFNNLNKSIQKGWFVGYYVDDHGELSFYILWDEPRRFECWSYEDAAHAFIGFDGCPAFPLGSMESCLQNIDYCAGARLFKVDTEKNITAAFIAQELKKIGRERVDSGQIQPKLAPSKKPRKIRKSSLALSEMSDSDEKPISLDSESVSSKAKSRSQSFEEPELSLPKDTSFRSRGRSRSHSADVIDLSSEPTPSSSKRKSLSEEKTSITSLKPKRQKISRSDHDEKNDADFKSRDFGSPQGVDPEQTILRQESGAQYVQSDSIQGAAFLQPFKDDLEQLCQSHPEYEVFKLAIGRHQFTNPIVDIHIQRYMDALKRSLDHSRVEIEDVCSMSEAKTVELTELTKRLCSADLDRKTELEMALYQYRRKVADLQKELFAVDSRIREVQQNFRLPIKLLEEKRDQLAADFRLRQEFLKSAAAHRESYLPTLNK